MANQQSFEPFNDESLNTSDVFLNRKSKGKEVSETARVGKAKTWSDDEGTEGRRRANEYGAGLFSKD